MKKIALDNPLEDLSIQLATDFTTIQTLRIFNLSLRDLFSNGYYIEKESGCYVEFFIEDQFWSSGERITSHSWLDGINLSLSENIGLRRLAQSINLKIKVKRNKLTFSSSSNAKHLIDLLSIPNFAPIGAPFEFSGPYRLHESNTGWHATPNPYSASSATEELSFVYEGDPYESVRLFYNNLIDKTPESCLPLELWNSPSTYLRSYPSDLTGYVSFSPNFDLKFSSDLRIYIF